MLPFYLRSPKETKPELKIVQFPKAKPLEKRVIRPDSTSNNNSLVFNDSSDKRYEQTKETQ